jgi:nicotinamidase-related amidase
MKSALLVIDVQQGLCEGRWAAHDINGVIDRINALSQKARTANVPVVMIQHESSDLGDLLAYGSAGWQFATALTVKTSDIRMRKRATDSFHNTPLQSILEQHAIEHVVICGLQTEFCVDTTTRRAMALGYSGTLVADAHSTCDNDALLAPQIIAHHNHTLANIESFGPRVYAVPAHAISFTN